MKRLNIQTGASLIETIIALFVLAIGVLGVLSMQVKSIQYNKNSHLYSQATFLANDIYEGMLVTPDDANNYVILYDDPTPSKPNCITSTCTPSALVSWNLNNWRNNVESLLPGGRSEIESVDGQYVIRIEFELGYEDDGTPQTYEYTMVADI